MDAVGASREDGHTDDPQEQIEAGSGEPSTGAQEGTGEEHPEGLQGQRHVRIDGHVEPAQLDGRNRDGDVGPDDEQQRAGSDQHAVAEPGGRLGPPRDGQQRVGERRVGGRVAGGRMAGARPAAVMVGDGSRRPRRRLPERTLFPMRRHWRAITLVVVAVVAIVCVGGFVWLNDLADPTARGHRCPGLRQHVSVTTDGDLVFRPAEPSRPPASSSTLAPASPRRPTRPRLVPSPKQAIWWSSPRCPSAWPSSHRTPPRASSLPIPRSSTGSSAAIRLEVPWRPSSRRTPDAVDGLVLWAAYPPEGTDLTARTSWSAPSPAPTTAWPPRRDRGFGRRDCRRIPRSSRSEAATTPSSAGMGRSRAMVRRRSTRPISRPRWSPRRSRSWRRWRHPQPAASSRAARSHRAAGSGARTVP